MDLEIEGDRAAFNLPYPGIAISVTSLSGKRLRLPEPAAFLV